MNLGRLFVLSFFCLSAAGIVGNAGQIPQTSELGPSDVVAQFMAAVETGDEERIDQLTTTVPNEYNDAKHLEVALYARRTGKEFEFVRTVERDTQPVRIELAPPVSSRQLIEDQLPNLRSDRAYLAKIDQAWTHFKEARVRVELRSRKSDSYLRRDDFLLFQKDGKWKIFLIGSISLVNVYGLPTPEFLPISVPISK